MMKKELTYCRLCLDVLKEPRQLPCFHSFCLSCLQKFDLSAGDEFHCPTCDYPLEITSEDLSELKVDNFVSRIVSQDGTTSEGLCSGRLCQHHPTTKINFFCIDCEVAGCPICSTGTHDTHRCIDLSEMGSVIRDELKNMCRDLKTNLSWMNVEFCKEKQLGEGRQKQFAEVCDEIKERGELVKKAVDRQIENLLKQVETVKKRSLKENEAFVKKNTNLMENGVKNFIVYVDELAVHGLPEELIDSVRDVKARADQLKQARVNTWSSDKMGVNFISSDLHVDTLSLVGHVEITKARNTRVDDKKEDKMNDHKNQWHNILNLTGKQSSNEEMRSSRPSKNGTSLRKIPESELLRSINVDRNVAAVAAGRGEFFVAVEHTGDILRYDSDTLSPNHPELKVDGLETPWDMTAISSDEMLTTYLFVVDNLQGKLFQVNVPYNNSSTDSNKFVRKVWRLGLSDSVTLSSSSGRLMLASTANKIIEYSLSSLLISSLSSSPSSSSSPLRLPEPSLSVSMIPHMTDVLHASRVSGDKLVAFFDHLYSLSGGFLINSWGKMICSFGEGRGNIPHCQIDYPSHVAVDWKQEPEEADDGDDDLAEAAADASRASPPSDDAYNDSSFIFLCDNGNDRITLLDGDLNFLKVFVEKVDEPWRMSVDLRRRLLFVATLQRSVKVFKY